MNPIGRRTAAIGRTLSRAFDAALEEAGGSLATWLILLAAKQRRAPTQRELAEAVGIGSPTMTRHLDNLEVSGLVRRRRDPEDRRAMRVELTTEGEQAFHRLRGAATAFDERLRTGFSEDDLARLYDLYDRLERNLET